MLFYQTLVEVQSKDIVIYYNYVYNSLTVTGLDCTMVFYPDMIGQELHFLHTSSITIESKNTADSPLVSGELKPLQ